MRSVTGSPVAAIAETTTGAAALVAAPTTAVATGIATAAGTSSRAGKDEAAVFRSGRCSCTNRITCASVG
jgi:hypothetical protein